MLTYELPHDRIALHPLEERDASKLLVYRGPLASIEHATFRRLSDFLRPDSLLVVNQTRVIAARLYLKKPTGGVVEVLITDPVAPSTDPAFVLACSTPSQWRCLIGGRNVNPGMILVSETEVLRVTVLERESTEGLVELDWDGSQSLAEVIEQLGKIPLPPYIHREADMVDEERYQTIYARENGSVAAPTAGLHFTDRVMNDLAGKGIDVARVTLHVGLGTFRPVEAEDLRDHVMHSERLGVTRLEIDRMLAVIGRGAMVTAVGTTSIRTLESLFLWGARLLRDGDPGACSLAVQQWDAFDPQLTSTSRHSAFSALADWMDRHAISSLWGTTQLMIAPGCRVSAVDALVTNFHQPGNTLLALIAGFVGEQHWKSIYDAALENNYRFLSYGDSSLLFRRDYSG
ncbi:MAG: hypothetical protein RL594_1414 [Bacteroidota bacterium]|jgi:S-adenosylmethionine:tRNA ribosyltransferase-isomerase